MPPKQLMSLAGAILVAIGVFCPLVSLPLVGSVSYFANGKGDGTIVLVAAIIAGWLALQHSYKPAAAVAVGMLALITYVVVGFQSRMSELKSTMAQDLQDNPFAGLAEGVVNSVQLQWGLGLMVIGALLIFTAAFWNPQPDSLS